MTVRTDFSLRYGVIGFYRDRSGSPFIIYPLPFVRIRIAK